MKIAELLSSLQASYEPDRLPFVQPAKDRFYIPDFKLKDKVYIEAKGRLTIEDRQKMLWVKEQYPDYTFYLLFGNSQNKLTKKSKTTYAMWAEANGFKWADIKDGIPKSWTKGIKKNNENPLVQ